MFTVETKTSFWKHPFKWWKDRKTARLMRFIIAYQWEHGGKEDFERMWKHQTYYGHTPLGNPCAICNK